MQRVKSYGMSLLPALVFALLNGRQLNLILWCNFKTLLLYGGNYDKQWSCIKS